MQLGEISTRPNLISDWKSWSYKGNFTLVLLCSQTLKKWLCSVIIK